MNCVEVNENSWLIAIDDKKFQVLRADRQSQWRVEMIQPEKRRILEIGGFSIELLKRDLKKAVESGDV